MSSEWDRELNYLIERTEQIICVLEQKRYPTAEHQAAEHLFKTALKNFSEIAAMMHEGKLARERGEPFAHGFEVQKRMDRIETLYKKVEALKVLLDGKLHDKGH